jgi:hypothetical protein
VTPRAVLGAGTACPRIAATVLPPPLAQRPPDAEGAGGEVDVGPLESERLALAETESQGDGPLHGVGVLGRGRQDGAGLDNREGHNLALLDRPGTRCGHRVAAQPPPLDRFPKTGTVGSVGTLHRDRQHTPGEEADVELLDVL